MARRSVTILTLLVWTGIFSGCASVPEEAGFPDIQKLIDQRIGRRVHWNQGTPAAGGDRQVRGLVAAEPAAALFLFSQ